MIPVYQPYLNGNEKKYVVDCLETGWISSKGKYNNLFSEAFAKYIGTSYATTVTNGTLALHLAILSLGIGVGDEVLVPTFTYIASANAVMYTGAKVVFVDSCKETWQIDPRKIEEKITGNTKAIIVVHLYGHPCDMDAILNIAQKHNLYVIEDCAEAIGSEYKGKKVGSFGDIAAFSFFGNKTITCGEGGMVVTNNSELFELAERIKGQGLAKNREYWHDIVGYNYRMTNIAAAVGLAQLEQVEEIIERKMQIADLYFDRLSRCPVSVHRGNSDVKHTYWMNSILCNSSEERAALRYYLRSHDIETRPTFSPIHCMPMYSTNSGAFPVAERLGECGINLPSYPGLSDEQVVYICNEIERFFTSRD